MDGRFPARLSAGLVLVALALAGCEEGASMQTGSTAQAGSQSGSLARSAPAQGKTEAERQLAKRSEAMQRTMLEATGSGAGLGLAVGILFGFDVAAATTGGGAGVGAGAGSYVATLQQDYATDEQRLDRMISDLETANTDAEAVLESMRAVLAEQTAQITALRAEVTTNETARTLLAGELQDLQQNVDTMQAAISGADGRLADARSARSIVDPAQATVRIDPQLGELSRRIAAMREIATTLAREA